MPAARILRLRQRTLQVMGRDTWSAACPDDNPPGDEAMIGVRIGMTSTLSGTGCLGLVGAGQEIVKDQLMMAMRGTQNAVHGHVDVALDDAR